MDKKRQVYLLDTEQIKEGSIVSLDENQHERNNQGGYTSEVTQYKGELSIAEEVRSKSYNGFTPKHLYFTSDEDIKKGDWILCAGAEGNCVPRLLKYTGEELGIAKIVATTNPELCQQDDEYSKIKNLGRIGDDFVEGPFIKSYNEGKPITEVNLEYEEGEDYYAGECGGGEVWARHPDILKLRSNGTVIISPVVEKMYTRDEVKDILKHFDIESGVGDNCGPTTRTQWFEQNYPK
jgi:hypothetical protein